MARILTDGPAHEADGERRRVEISISRIAHETHRVRRTRDACSLCIALIWRVSDGGNCLASRDGLDTATKYLKRAVNRLSTRLIHREARIMSMYNKRRPKRYRLSAKFASIDKDPCNWRLCTLEIRKMLPNTVRRGRPRECLADLQQRLNTRKQD